ncbi:MAG: DUF4215 domain-containing protein, partial [Deltaproteobacteria bacterium]|nr:DUF4215 domain-containing protein [Deltaproteobacteria bacterium]
DDCDPATPDVADGDGDGDACDVDCDDADPAVGPGQAELCNSGKDEDCDQDVDCADEDCAEDPICLLCGNGELDPGEDCDDGNDCRFDGCHGCAFEPSVVIADIHLSSSAGFDLDDLDGDGDIYTGIDSLAASDSLMVMYLNQFIDLSLEQGLAIQLFTFGQLDNVPYEGVGTPGYEQDDEILISSYAGLDPACPPHASPVPWISWSQAPFSLYSDADSFQACAPEVLITEADDPANGIYPTTTDPAQPEAPFLHFHAPKLNVSLGSLGTLEFVNTYAEASVDNDGRDLTGLRNGVLGGILPVHSLAAIDISAATSGLCPTALHALLGFVGQPDQDAEGNGQLDTIQYSCSLGCMLACISSRVSIQSCTDDETGVVIPGADCVNDPRIRDGFSAGFTFSAPYAHVTGQASGAGYCP